MKQAASVKLGRGHSGYTWQKPSQNKNVFVIALLSVQDCHLLKKSILKPLFKLSLSLLRALLQFQVYFQLRDNCTSSYFLHICLSTRWIRKTKGILSESIGKPKENQLKYTGEKQSRYKDVTLYIYRTIHNDLIYTAVLNHNIKCVTIKELAKCLPV